MLNALSFLSNSVTYVILEASSIVINIPYGILVRPNKNTGFKTTSKYHYTVIPPYGTWHNYTVILPYGTQHNYRQQDIHPSCVVLFVCILFQMRKNRQATEKDDSKSDSDVKHHETDNVKQTNNTRKSVPPAATIGHLPSFSSLFTNNPDIPSVQR